MRLAAVEPAHDFLLQSVSFRRVLRFDHSFGELTEFLRAKTMAFLRVTGELNDSVSLISWQPFYLFNDFHRRHAMRLLVTTRRSKPGAGDGRVYSLMNP